MLIAFTGRKGSGKDTAASVFVDRGYHHLKLADPLKEMLTTLFYEQGATDEEIEAALEGADKEKPSEYLAGKTPRFAMQTLGTEWGRDTIGGDFWVGCFRNKAARIHNVVVSDVRFQNEVDVIHEMGGQVYRIQRPSLGAANDLHPSEAMIEALVGVTDIGNNFSSGAEWREYVSNLFSAGLNDAVA